MSAQKAEGLASRAAEADDWRLLLALCLYRLLLVILLTSLQQLGALAQFFDELKPSVFHSACLLYALAALLLVIPAVSRRPALPVQSLANFVLDLIAVMVLVYASGGVQGGLGLLLLPSVVGASLHLSARLATLLAAVATFASFGEEIIHNYPYFYTPSNFTAVGVLSLMFFVTATAANAVARRARASEALARKVGDEFEDLSRLNTTVVDSMQTGVVVVDEADRLRALNASGARLLSAGGHWRGQALSILAPALAESLGRWRGGSAAPEAPVLVQGSPPVEVLPRFRRLGVYADSPVLILLEDAARIREQAQQIKLAALGRLSASIAHEIRNPLSAITHAGQLLAESGLPVDDQRLVEIVLRHGARINAIVKDVLSLSRGASEMQTLALGPWLERSLASYREGRPGFAVALNVEPGLMARFDPNHLQQVLYNLLDNAAAHGRSGEQPPNIAVRARALYLQGGALEVEDDGPGVPEAAAEHLFEPFFTTTAQGTGLGLYLARELCAYNQAKLSYHPREAGAPAKRGALFRITFVAPDAESPPVPA